MNYLLAIVVIGALLGFGASYGYTTAQIEYATRGGCMGPQVTHPLWPK